MAYDSNLLHRRWWGWTSTTWPRCSRLVRVGSEVRTASQPSPKETHQHINNRFPPMDVLPPPPELSSDIRRAIQQAVGQANDAFINHQVTGQPETAKRKRRRDSTTKEGDVTKQKKRKGVPEAARTSSQESSSASTAHQLGAQPKRANEVSSKPNTPSTQVVPNMADNESLVPSSPPQSQSPHAFLDAVVSAASETGAPSETPYSFSDTCFDPPSSSSYPFSAIPNELPLNSAAFQQPDSFSSVTGPDLDYASNDDILHTLQDHLDVTKIASVLKTLGEAAAAANVPLTSLPSTLLRRQQPATPNDSAPSSSVGIPECHVPPVSQHDRHLVDLNTHRELAEHSDHAELLATKWLSAQKLAELAKSQGKSCDTSRVA
jgi:ribosome assembly protein YihI (activator of Der GTPase)